MLLKLGCMATLSLALSVSAGSRKLPAHDVAYKWRQELPFGSGAWQESWIEGRTPLALVPVAGPDARAWMVGGRGVWSSRDGIVWQRVAAALPWGDRYGAVPAYFRGELWAIGGEESGVKRNDVYHSRDGVTWKKSATPPFSARRWHSATMFRDRLWVMGGGSASGNLNDVWSTADGEQWRLETSHAPWAARGRHAAVVWRDRLCIVGGGEFTGAHTDVWCATDGRTWNRIIEKAPWSQRILPGVAVLDDQLWVFGGSEVGRAGDASWLGDVWRSADGVTWERAAARAPWSSRSAMYNVVFRDRLWVYGGKGIEANGRGGFADDVWTLQRMTD